MSAACQFNGLNLGPIAGKAARVMRDLDDRQDVRQTVVVHLWKQIEAGKIHHLAGALKAASNAALDEKKAMGRLKSGSRERTNCDPFVFDQAAYLQDFTCGLTAWSLVVFGAQHDPAASLVIASVTDGLSLARAAWNVLGPYKDEYDVRGRCAAIYRMWEAS